MPDLGIGEALAAFGGTDLLAGLGSLLGFGEGAAPVAAAGLGAGAELAGPTVAGTAFDFLAPEAAGATSAALGGGPTALGTAADFLAAPQAIGGATALGGAGAFGGAADLAASEAGSSGLASGTSGIGASPSIASLVPADVGGITSSIPGSLPAAGQAPISGPTGGVSGTPFGGNTAGIPGLSQGVGSTPNLIPAGGGGGGASGIAGPIGASPVDATAAIPSGVPGTAGSNLAGPIAPGSVGAGPSTGAASTSISDLLSKAGSQLTNNPLQAAGIALGAGGLGYNILQGQKDSYNKAALTTDANIAAGNSQQMVQSGEALQQYLTNGTLPPAYQQQVDQAIADAKTNAISNAAAQGLSTDPTKNTALAATLAKIDASKAGMQTSVASQLFSSGTSLVNSGAAAAGLSGQLFTSLMNNDTTQAANTGKAIATLAAAMNGKSQASASGQGGSTITIG